MTINLFKFIVYNHYRTHGRNFPWRETCNPYRILVSEVMLQQTQVSRVVPKYREFLQNFPTALNLSRAPLQKILNVWQGLGYNRRVLLLKRCSGMVVRKYGGRVPRNVEILRQLPGVGSYTASAIAVFAYNKPELLIETNIRSVFIHHFFKNRKLIRDDEILPFIQKTLDRKNPRRWYWALMDYGATLKKTVTNPSRQSAHHLRQIPFKGSERELRGMIIRLISKRQMMDKRIIDEVPRFEKLRIRKTLRTLTAEGFLTKRKGRYCIT